MYFAMQGTLFDQSLEIDLEVLFSAHSLKPRAHLFNLRTNRNEDLWLVFTRMGVGEEKHQSTVI